MWQLIKTLDFKQLFRLFWLFLTHPVYAVPTIFATKKCMDIANKEYGSKHHFGNRANAFRHALWVNLIIKKCLKWHKNEEKAKAWAKRITDWHEVFAKNETLEKAMDLHNNAAGITFYKEIQHNNEAEMITFLKKKASEAIQIETVADANKMEKSLVFIE